MAKAPIAAMERAEDGGSEGEDRRVEKPAPEAPAVRGGAEVVPVQRPREAEATREVVVASLEGRRDHEVDRVEDDGRPGEEDSLPE